MQSAKAKLPVLFITASVICACALRFFQLFTLTDASTGAVIGGKKSSIALYVLMLFCAVICAVSALRDKKSQNKTLVFSPKGKAVFISSCLLSVCFFFNFIRLCFNCYSCTQTAAYISASYIVPLMLSAVFAILSCFYFAVLALTARGSNYDFKNFTVFHFAPAVWAFLRLCILMTGISLMGAVEAYIEVAVLALIICFVFCFAYTVDNKDGVVAPIFAFSCRMLLAVSAILTVPRLLMLITGNGELLYNAELSLGTYLMLGVFAVSVISRQSENNK